MLACILKRDWNISSWKNLILWLAGSLSLLSNLLMSLIFIISCRDVSCSFLLPKSYNFHIMFVLFLSPWAFMKFTRTPTIRFFNRGGCFKTKIKEENRKYTPWYVLVTFLYIIGENEIVPKSVCILKSQQIKTSEINWYNKWTITFTTLVLVIIFCIDAMGIKTLYYTLSPKLEGYEWDLTNYKRLN